VRERIALIVVLCAVAGGRVSRADDLEPYLAASLEGVVEQIRSDDTSYPLKQLAARHLLRRYPKAGPDALVEFLYHPGAQFNSEVGRMLSRSRLPNSRTEQLVGDIALGRFKWTKEQIEAFADAVAWPGNDAALPVLQRMIDERWDTADTGRFYSGPRNPNAARLPRPVNVGPLCRSSALDSLAID